MSGSSRTIVMMTLPHIYIYTVAIVVLIQSYLHLIRTPQGLDRHFRSSILVLSPTIQNDIRGNNRRTESRGR